MPSYIRKPLRHRNVIDQTSASSKASILARGTHQGDGYHQARLARGPVQLDLATKSPIQNIYIKKVEKKKMFGYDKDELCNTVVITYNDVSTYWQYDPAKFRAQPVYSRNFPPCSTAIAPSDRDQFVS